MRKIKIGDKEYNYNCSAYTYFNFKKIFNKSIFDDIKYLQNYLVDKYIYCNPIKDMDNFVKSVTRIAYIQILEVENLDDYEIWLTKIKSINTADNWIDDIATNIIRCFYDERTFIELDKLSEDNKKELLFPEHDFIAFSLKIGLTMADLKTLSYVDVMKIMLSLTDSAEQNNKTNIREATQEDIDKLLG